MLLKDVNCLSTIHGHARHALLALGGSYDTKRNTVLDTKGNTAFHPCEMRMIMRRAGCANGFLNEHVYQCSLISYMKRTYGDSKAHELEYRNELRFSGGFLLIGTILFHFRATSLTGKLSPI